MKTTMINGIDLSKVPQPILERHPNLVDLYHVAWRLGANRVRTTDGLKHMDCGFGPKLNHQWLWDTCFMALFCRYSNGQFPGIQSLDNFYLCQKRNGYISMCYDMATRKERFANRINPPLFAWTEWEHYKTTGDAGRFAYAVPRIEKLMAWIDANRLNEPHYRRAIDTTPVDQQKSLRPYSLYFFEDCGSSGMDDSPRTPRMETAGRYYDWIDLSSQMALSFRMLGRMRAVLGHRAKAAHWEQRALQLGQLINEELWCERTNFYHDRTIPRNFVGHKTVAGFWPILAGFCDKPRLNALIAHLLDEREFNRPTPVPSLSADDPNYSEDGIYWIGGVWASTNYMITRGLMQAGKGDLAHQIAMKYVHVIDRTYRKFKPHTIWESYCPEHDRPGRFPYEPEWVRKDFVGWSGIGPIAMLIENILGIELDAPARHIDWNIRLTEAHGIRQLGIPGGQIDLLCAARKTEKSRASITITATSDVEVAIHNGPRHKTRHIPAGATVALTV